METTPTPLNILIVPVKSSALAGHGYDDATHTLAIQFKANGPIYHYAGVPLELYLKLQGAESVGRFFAAEIKGKFGEPVKLPAPQEKENTDAA